MSFKQKVSNSVVDMWHILLLTVTRSGRAVTAVNLTVKIFTVCSHANNYYKLTSNPAGQTTNNNSAPSLHDFYPASFYITKARSKQEMEKDVQSSLKC